MRTAYRNQSAWDLGCTRSHPPAGYAGSALGTCRGGRLENDCVAPPMAPRLLGPWVIENKNKPMVSNGNPMVYYWVNQWYPMVMVYPIVNPIANGWLMALGESLHVWRPVMLVANRNVLLLDSFHIGR